MEFICQRFGTLCLFHLHMRVGTKCYSGCEICCAGPDPAQQINKGIKKESTTSLRICWSFHKWYYDMLGSITKRTMDISSIRFKHHVHGLTHSLTISYDYTLASCFTAQAEWSDVSAVRHPKEIRTVVRRGELQD
jgi:hypothetical protein